MILFHDPVKVADKLDWHFQANLGRKEGMQET